MLCARKVYGNSSWPGVMAASTCVVLTGLVATFARSRICPARAFASWAINLWSLALVTLELLF